MDQPASPKQLTCQCASCTHKHGIPPYIDITPTHIQPVIRPTYCPNCAKPRSYHPYDWADVLCHTYMGMTRELAISIIRQFNEWRASSFRTPVRNSQIDVLDYLRDRGHAAMPIRSYIVPLNVQCNDCGGQYDLVRGTVAQRPPKYCVWCGSKNIALTNSEEAAYVVLAKHYALPENIITYLYQEYTKQGQHITFESYMTSPTIQAIRDKLAPLASATA